MTGASLTLPQARACTAQHHTLESKRRDRTQHHHRDVRAEHAECSRGRPELAQPGRYTEVGGSRDGRHRDRHADACAGAGFESEHARDSSGQGDGDRLVVDTREAAEGTCFLEVEPGRQQVEGILGQREDRRSGGRGCQAKCQGQKSPDGESWLTADDAVAETIERPARVAWTTLTRLTPSTWSSNSATVDITVELPNTSRLIMGPSLVRVASTPVTYREPSHQKESDDREIA